MILSNCISSVRLQGFFRNFGRIRVTNLLLLLGSNFLFEKEKRHGVFVPTSSIFNTSFIQLENVTFKEKYSVVTLFALYFRSTMPCWRFLCYIDDDPISEGGQD